MNKIELIYQLFAGRWESANVLDHSGEVLKRMSDFEWEILRDIYGSTHVYLLGLYDTRGRVMVEEESGLELQDIKNRTPSPFAISDHKSVHPDLGSEAELLELIRTIQEKDLGVIVDFVPHHTGMDHPWTQDHEEYYAKDEHGEIIRAFSGDVLKLDYSNQALCEEMVSVMLHIASWGVDGMRVDMAHLVPNAFWKDALARVKEEYPHLTIIAEAYTDTLLDLSPLSELLEIGFDYIYHEPLFRNLKQFYAEGAPLSYTGEHLTHVLENGMAHQLVEYLGNHDDPPIKEGLEDWEALFALTLFMPGPSMIFNGFLHGLDSRLGHHYVEILKEQYSFWQPLEEDVLSLMQLFKKERPVITSAHVIQDSSLFLELSMRSGTGFAVLNLSKEPLSLQSIVREGSMGLFRSLDNRSSLEPGKAEIFLLPN